MLFRSEALRIISDLRFFIKVTPPTEKKNDVNMKNFPLLKEEDEIQFTINNEQDYSDAFTFLRSTVITRPTVLFNFTDIEVYQQFLKDVIIASKEFVCPFRISNIK